MIHSFFIEKIEIRTSLFCGEVVCLKSDYSNINWKFGLRKYVGNQIDVLTDAGRLRFSG